MTSLVAVAIAALLKGNARGVKTNPIAWNGRPFAIDFHLPGMTTLFFLPANPPAGNAEARAGD